MAKDDATIWLLAAGAVAVGFYLYAQNQGILPAGTGLPTATPLSVYPEFAYTAQTSMASTPQQQATAQAIPIPAFTSVQGQETAAVLGQCAGAYPGCTILTGDTQLGF